MTLEPTPFSTLDQSATARVVLDDTTVGDNLGRETTALSGGKVVHTAVVTVVHVVVETVDPIV